MPELENSLFCKSIPCVPYHLHWDCADRDRARLLQSCYAMNPLTRRNLIAQAEEGFSKDLTACDLS